MSQYQIKIDEPCNENWNSMTPKEKGRFCGVCTKDVVDFTKMNDQEVKSYFTNYKGTLCGRFKKSQLEKKDERYFKLSAYSKQFVRAFAMVFIMFTSCNTDAQSDGHIKGKIAVVANQAISCTGLVYNENGASIPNASILIQKNGSTIRKIVTDNKGAYAVKLKEGTYDIVISKEGYAQFETGVTVSDSGTFGDFELQQDEGHVPDPEILGMIEIGEPVMIEPKK